MTLSTTFYHRLALIGYFGLLIWVPVWHYVLTGGMEKSPLFVFIVWIIPLLLPLRGIIKNQPYTFAWANFVVMIYLMHSLTAMYVNENERLFALVELVFAIMMFIGGSVYARKRGKELGMGLKKLKEVMAEEKARFER